VRTLSIGVDLVEIRRIERMLERFGNRSMRHLLTEREQEFCLRRPKAAQHVAGRVAGKEASYKALQATANAAAIHWLEIEVVAANGGRPELIFSGRAREAAERLGVQESLISISHSVDTAIATVVLNG